MNSYLSRIRSKIGNGKIIHPGARILVENEVGDLLFIQRKDNGLLGLPAGSMEDNESVVQCIIREVKEETGIEIVDLEVIGIKTNPNSETVRYNNGDVVQYFVVEFYSNSWAGEVSVQDQHEIMHASFKSPSFLKDLPPNERSIVDSLRYFREKGRIKVL